MCAAPVERTYIDLRDDEGARLHAVTIAADGTEQGHAFIVWEQEDDQQKMTTHETWGFYPVLPPDGQPTTKDYLKVMSGFGEGTIVDDERSMRAVEAVVRVDAEAYERARGVYQQWAKPGHSYVLGLSDCTTFAGSVVSAAGLQTPSRLLHPYPLNYVKEIINLDKPNRDIRNEKRAQKAEQKEREARERAEHARRLAERARKLKWGAEASLALHLSAQAIAEANAEIERCDEAIARQERHAQEETETAQIYQEKATKIRTQMQNDGVKILHP
jgi:hypothetical protein